MDSFLVTLASLPSLVIYSIIGTIAGALGALIGLLCKGFWPTAPRWVPVIFAVISTQLSPVAVSRLHAQSGPEAVVNDIEKNRLFKVIFQYHPEAKGEMLSGFQKIFAGPRDQVHAQSQLLGAEISNRYYNIHIATASDAAIHNVLNANFRIMEALKEKPKTCVGFYLETGFNVSDIPATFLEEGTNAKAAVIESSIKSPTNREKLTAEQLVIALIASYQKNGITHDNALAEIEKLDTLNSLPAEEGCTIASHFSAALANMDEKTAASTFTSLIALGK
jgi:hypothetical protein